jgi:branched-chain amino acid transport system permease protein
MTVESNTRHATTARPNSEAIAFLVMVLVLVVAPAFVYPVSLMKALCFALFACAFNLLIGYAGLLSFGHALFFGWGAYLAAHLAKVGTLSLPYWAPDWAGGWAGGWHWFVIALPPLPPELAILGGTLFAALLGLAVGTLAIRRQGIYFAMTTLALAQMMYFFAVQAPFTHGEDGIQAVPRGMLFGFIDLRDQTAMYAVTLTIFLASFLMIHRIINSPFGEVLKAIRENEPRAISLGYHTQRYKLVAFVLSAMFAGLAGSTKAIVFQLASLTDVDWPMSGEVILMTLVGGLGTLFGPVVGAFFVVTIENYLTQIGQWVFVVQGAIFVICVLLFRRGIVGEVAQRMRIRL